MAKATKTVTKAVVKALAPEAKNDNIHKDGPQGGNRGNPELDKLISTIASSVADLQRTVAIACAKAVTHAVEHGDTTYGLKLVAALSGEGKAVGKTIIRGNLIRAWLETYGPFRWEEKTFKLNKKKQAELLPRIKTPKDRQKFERELSEDCKPWELKPEKAYKGIDVLKIMEQTIKRIETEAKKHADDPKTNVTYLDEFKATLHKVKVAHADAVAKVAKAAKVA